MSSPKTRFLKTSQIAEAVGVHSNTVRLYEEWGFLPPIPRAPNGYRRYTTAHLEQMRLGRMALHGQWPGKRIRESALALVRTAASGKLSEALTQARHHLMLVQEERQHADAAIDFLERWARDAVITTVAEPLRIGETAQRLDVTIDMLRDWERNGMLSVPRDTQNGYRRYGPAEIGRCRVIRLLRRAGYSPMAILRMLLQFDRDSGTDLRRALNTPRPDEDVYVAADQWLSTLNAQEERARSLISQIEKMIQISE